MKMSWTGNILKNVKKRVMVPLLAVAVAGSLAGYELAKPVPAAAVATPSVSPLDDNSVGALLALDHAMETLAARVTPAVVNVVVTSKTKPQAESEDGNGPTGQQFGEGNGQPNWPFGNFGPFQFFG